MVAGLGKPKWAAVETLCHTPGLTIINVIFAPPMAIMPHGHQMWAGRRL